MTRHFLSDTITSMNLDNALTIFIDTREQQPLEFSAPYIKETVRCKLEYGDYSCRAFDRTCPVFFERKGLSDLFGTLGKGSARFREEIRRCFDDGYKLVIIIERPLGAIKTGARHSTIPGSSIIRTLFTLSLKYNIDFVCCNSRAEMELYIREFYYSYFKNIEFLDENFAP